MNEILLRGLEASNPLGFLAALGTLRTLDTACPDGNVRMAWRLAEGAWRPVVVGPFENQDALLDTLEVGLPPEPGPELTQHLGDDLTVSREVFQAYAQEAARAATSADRRWADAAAAFASDAFEADRVPDTALRTMAGAGHQHFLLTMRRLIEACERHHLASSLFAAWEYLDPIQKMSLRWELSDDVRHAHRWNDPSGDPARQRSGSQLGAQRLAIDGMALLPTAPAEQRLETTCFVGKGSQGTYFLWPVWEPLLSLNLVYCLLAQCLTRNVARRGSPNEELHHLRDRGVACLYRSQRITVGKMRNFTPAERVM